VQIDAINPMITHKYDRLPVDGSTASSTGYLSLDGVVLSTSNDYENLTERPTSTVSNGYQQLQFEM